MSHESPLSSRAILHHPPRACTVSAPTVENLKFLPLSPKRRALLGQRRLPAPAPGVTEGQLGSGARPRVPSPPSFRRRELLRGILQLFHLFLSLSIRAARCPHRRVPLLCSLPLWFSFNYRTLLFLLPNLPLHRFFSDLFSATDSTLCSSSLSPSSFRYSSIFLSLYLFLFLFYLLSIYLFSLWVWICHHFFSLKLEYLHFFPASSCASLPLYVVVRVSSAGLAPQYFTFLKLKNHRHPLKGLRNFISFTFNYRLYARGLPQPPSSPSFPPCALSPAPFCPPCLENHFLAIIAGRQKSVVYLLVYILKKIYI